LFKAQVRCLASSSGVCIHLVSPVFCMSIYCIRSLGFLELRIASVVSIWDVFAIEGPTDDVVHFVVSVSVQGSFLWYSCSVEAKVQLSCLRHDLALTVHKMLSHAHFVNGFVSFMQRRFNWGSVDMAVRHSLNGHIFVFSWPCRCNISHNSLPQSWLGLFI
jgi:hypothetical protein